MTRKIAELPAPALVTNNPGVDWPRCWRMWQSGVLAKVARDVLYQLLHDRVGTRVRGKEKMPRVYKNARCPRCEKEYETTSHRYRQC